jgi:hypothetical protein
MTVFSIPINVATATMVDIDERLCWLHTTDKSTIAYDAIGNSYPLSDLTELSAGQIPYPEQFVIALIMRRIRSSGTSL